MKDERIRSVFRVVVVVDAPAQTEEDMELNAQEYIKMDCDNDDLYIELISHVNDFDEITGETL